MAKNKRNPTTPVRGTFPVRLDNGDTSRRLNPPISKKGYSSIVHVKGTFPVKTSHGDEIRFTP